MSCSYLTYLETIDLFGYPVHFNVGKQHVYTSTLGGLFTLLTIFVVLYVNWSNIVSFSTKDTLIYSSKTQYDMDPSLIHLNPENYMIALSIDQPYFNTRPFFNISIEQKWYERFENGTLVKLGQQIQLAACQYDQFQKVFNLTGYNFTDTYNKLNLKTWLCPTEVNFTLRGIYQSSNFDFLKITVSKCKNDTSNTWKPSCAPQKEVDSYLDKYGAFKVQIYTTNNIINPNKATDYVQQYFDDEMYFTFTPNKLSRQGNIYLRKFEFLNDESLWPWKELQQTVFQTRKPEDFRDLTELGRDTDDSFAVFYIRRSPLTEQITRSYQKINNLLGQIGGFVQIMLIAIGIFITFFNKQAFLLELANQLFEFNYLEFDVDKKHKDNLELLQVLNKTGTNVVRQDEIAIQKEVVMSPVLSDQQNVGLPLKFVDTNQRLEIIEAEEQVGKIVSEHQAQAYQLEAIDEMDYFSKYLNQLQKKKGVLILSSKALLNIMSCGVFFPKNKESIVLRKAINNIDKQLDIYTILEKLNEIEKVKQILFDDKQRMIFDFTPKPIISVQKQQLRNTKGRLQKSMIKINRSKVNSKKKQIEQNNQIQNAIQMSKDIYQVLNLTIQAYQYIIQSSKDTQRDINEELIKRLGPEVQCVYNISKLLNYDNRRITKLLYRQNNMHSWRSE